MISTKKSRVAEALLGHISKFNTSSLWCCALCFCRNRPRQRV